MKKIVMALSLLLAPGLHAADGDNAGVAFLHHFDQDRDGKVSLAEFRADGDRQFQAIDADGDGFATAAEAAAFEKRMRDSMRQRQQDAAKKRAQGSSSK